MLNTTVAISFMRFVDHYQHENSTSQGTWMRSNAYFTFSGSQADDNGDSKLSLEEMLNHEMLFYTSLLDVDEEEDDFHDEL